ncbi:spore coat protein GerQ [Lentibacillus amyloliquefaciens]|uniref:Spore coat protein GerQ n=1 Tax=Lentibacillus amyloliquefaciens TaxID=1472767 RepID=A0A0U4F2Y8_9BACI|nr:spore coat protein GerQ [Lentibacillus amyloliquefaciens]ALX49847.1 spore coat protein GerQ [Lentibacillus amyloliquefaciens]
MSEENNANYNNPYQANPYYYYPQSSPAYYPVYDPRQMPQNQQQQTPQTQQQQTPINQGMLPMEQSYIENILRLNEGKEATVYMTFENNEEWNAQIFRGIVEAAGRDHIILRDPRTGRRYLLLMIYLDYVTFDEELNYEYPYNSGGQMSQYSPR